MTGEPPPFDARPLLTEAVRVLSTGDLLLLMQAIATEVQSRWATAEGEPLAGDLTGP